MDFLSPAPTNWRTQEQVMQSGIKPESIGIISPYGAQAGVSKEVESSLASFGS